jgi:hypothetical protein
MRHTALLALALASAASVTHSQPSVIDQGRFVISRGGQRIGTEDFVIRRTGGPGGEVLLGSATVAMEDRRLSPALRTDPHGAPLAYQVEVRVGPSVKESLRGQVGRGRFSARIRTPGGESAKEYIVADGAIVLDDDVFYQYYFLGIGEKSGSVPVVVPRRNVQVTMRVDDRGSEAISIAGSRVDAHHMALTAPGEAERNIWFDASGRVLRVTIGDLVATRDELPR